MQQDTSSDKSTQQIENPPKQVKKPALKKPAVKKPASQRNSNGSKQVKKPAVKKPAVKKHAPQHRRQWSEAVDKKVLKHHKDACETITSCLLNTLDSKYKEMEEFIEKANNNGEPQFMLEPENAKDIKCFCFTEKFADYFSGILKSIAQTYFKDKV